LRRKSRDSSERLSRLVPGSFWLLAASLVTHFAVSLVLADAEVLPWNYVMGALYYAGWTAWAVIVARRWARGKGRVAAIALLSAFSFAVLVALVFVALIWPIGTLWHGIATLLVLGALIYAWVLTLTVTIVREFRGREP